MSPSVPKTPPRQIRIGDEWHEFDAVARSMGTERAELVRDFIAWYSLRPGARLPARPDVEAWQAGGEPTT
ncbi:hypothetical protein ABZ208_24230 [Streptomyces sp. NPDC006208]|uniref:hypothetical protein n=1 Tax=Streptomyces sp. NPDC006208 TaxID=3156734 RepID=UPI0033A1ED24